MQITQDGKYKFYIGLDIDEELVKGERKKLLRGVGSTESRDRHGEEMVLAGMDFQPYLEYGRVNYDHLPGAQHTLGKPIEAAIVPDVSRLKKSLSGPGFYHMCELYDTTAGNAAWELLKAERNDPNRQHGWSVEGAILQTQGAKLVKTLVEKMALTPTPANRDTFVEFVNTLSKTFSVAGTEGTMVLQNIDDNQDQGARANQAVNGFTQDNLNNLLFGDCNHNCYDDHGRFRLGARSALFHLVKCKGMDTDTAYALVKGIAGSGII